MATRTQEPASCPARGAGLSRRDFVKSSAFLGASAALAAKLDAIDLLRRAEAGELTGAGAYELAHAENVIYSVCLQCHTACPIKAKILDGVMVKVDGSPYSPQSLLPHIDYATPPAEAALLEGKVCPKGQAGVQTLYDPYRIVKVLKRSGPRGSGRWQTIPFAQAIDEIVEGGRLFAHVAGEEGREVEGLRSIFRLRDPVLRQALAADAYAVARGKMKLDDFKVRHARHLDVLIDPDHPDLGPVNNQFVMLNGRIEHGRKELGKRFTKDAFGSVNFFEHTTICEQSHHIAFAYATNKYKKGKWGKGKHHLKPDALNAEFICFFGTGAFEANFGPPPMAEKITRGLVDGRLKIAVVDPRLSKTAAKAWKWVPIKPGTDAALALGMVRWIMEKRRYDARYLTNANQGAAHVNGESTFSTASWLVEIGADGRPGRYLRAARLGLGDEDTFVVLSGGKPAPCKPYDKAAVHGDLLVETTLGGVRVKSALQLLWESAASRTVEQWAAECGVAAADIEALAAEFTSHGKRAVAEFYRGPVQHTNGYYNAQAIIALNVLLGNADWKGGWGPGGGHWHESGGKPGNPFNLKKLHPGKLGSFGIKVNREGAAYEHTTLFAGYPAKRPFYPFTGNLYQEVLPSAAAGYPYPVKALLLHMGTPGLSVPAAQHQIDVLADVDKLPLLIASDIVIGESTMYADYVFPDMAIWERWGTPHATPDAESKTSKFRQPVVGAQTATVKVFGERMPLGLETLLLGIAERLGLSGFGKDGFGPGMDFVRHEDYYLKLAANLAFGDKEGEAVPDADESEMRLFLDARRHLPPTVFNARRWQQAVGADKWAKVVYVLNRGGRYEAFADAYDGDYLKHRFGGFFSLYAEPIGIARHSVSGERFSGVPIYEPLRDAAGQPVVQDGFELELITYKDILGGQSRTLPTDYWLSSILPENYILMSTRDAERLGLEDGARAKIVSASNPEGLWDLRNGRRFPAAGKVKVVEGMRPGTVAVSWHFGHWAYGSADVVVDGKRIKGDPRRATGLCPNSVMLTDPYLGDVCLTDPIGGSASFYDTRVRVVKV